MAKDSGGRAREAAAAQRETDPEPITFDWRGLTLELPPVAPLALAFDLASMDTLSEAAIIRALGGVLGDAQFRALRNHLVALRIGLDDHAAFMELVDGILGRFGITLGESPASAGS